MKNKVLFIFFLVTVVFWGCGHADTSTLQDKSTENIISDTLNIATYNIRFKGLRDKSYLWKDRRDGIADIIKKYDFDVFGVQELRYLQYRDFKRLLPGYKSYDVGRYNGFLGEKVAIYYKESRFEIEQKGRYWLSDTPAKPGKGWDASERRVLVYVRMKDKHTGKRFYFLTTHLDAVGSISRLESAKLINILISKITEGEEIPCFLVADMNSPDTDPAMEQLRNNLNDSYYYVNPDLRCGPEGTYTGFDTGRDMNESVRDDYVYYKGDVELLNYVAIDTIINGNYPSDHLPVMVQVKL